jgi:arylsulfatase A-like enzyme
MNKDTDKANVIFVFADQWRRQATGYAGDPNAKTPTLDKLSEESINFTNAISGCPVCTPYRASFITGRYPTTHGCFLNDVKLSSDAVSIAQAFTAGGYNTAYIGKWHLHDYKRTAFIPRKDRQGFDFWKVLECTHDYNNSYYYADKNEKLKWDGYDAIAQTKEAIRYIEQYNEAKPFFMVLSWGPPHAPYQSAPEKYRRLFKPEDIKLRPNVPAQAQAKARKDLAGYYAHIAALDDCLKELLECLERQHIEENTLFVFTSDHGDMLGSHNHYKKQRPWEESVAVPFLLRYPGKFGRESRTAEHTIDAQDIMPTLLGLCELEIPQTVEGRDLSGYLQGETPPSENFGVLSCVAPFGQYTRDEHGGREYRGIRDDRYTYVKDLNGPWLLYDNRKDPYQMNNICGREESEEIQNRLEKLLDEELKRRGDKFEPAENYIKRWGYIVDQTGTVPYEDNSDIHYE